MTKIIFDLILGGLFLSMTVFLLAAAYHQFVKARTKIEHEHQLWMH